MMSREYYFHDCIAYFSRYVGRREWAWHGYSDVRGTLDTLGSYTEFFSDPPCEPWKDMTNAHALKKQKFTIVH
jgi:hypothetical protein